ncbi:hypothetical protein CORC01_09340 [Colletotrichum orchidophilum]|uniref:Uncharacterized protein n=1 Tax=Colletotrichum orchidophilum TaxID=1209926 RepID=A0A1G4B1M2_9PEZI|nr:uncharacterized protein CORC01_09340 [Colletotrichum orchidophilum]OHE95329.1 hypothetical protein CORC01_09340 [Colletotrichum orchidophilum]
MHFTSKILYVCVALHVAFQGASGAILRGRTSDTDSNQLSASDFQTLSQAAEDLDNQLDNFLRNWNGGHRNPDIVNTATIAKRQASGISVSAQDLQDLLKLIQSIERQLAAIIASVGTTASVTVAPAPSNTFSNPGPVASSPAQSTVQPTVTGNVPASSGVSSPTPNPVLTSSAAGDGGPLTTAYGTSITTGTRCKTTVTQTFTEYVYEDGTSVVPRVVRSIVEDEEVDEEEEEDHWITATVPRDSEDDGDWESWVEFDGTSTEEDESDVGFTTRDSWTKLGVRRRDSLGENSDPGLLFARDEGNI